MAKYLIFLNRCLLLSILLTASSAYGHMLNMTNIHILVDEQQQSTVTVSIDLGQSLLSAEDYWAATQAPLSEQHIYLQPALAQLKQSLRFLVDGEVRNLQMTDFEIGALSLDAIKNPLTPQMATLRYSLNVANGERIGVELDQGLEIPWPCLVKIDVFGQNLPQSRLLTDYDRISIDASLSEKPLMHTTSLANLMSGWMNIAPGVSWVAVGFQHIVPKGLDHMLFILGLFFLSSGWRLLLIQITGFTVAHSLTLGLSMYGVINLSAEIVEPLIALSIVYIAIDNLFSKQVARFRLLIVCFFGLLHGLGFASVLANIGLPQEQFLLGLGLFNLGVEIGQLTVIAGAYLIVGWCRRQVWYDSMVAQPATIVIAGTGAYWFLKRIAF
jgi:hypothetical protein